jgi:hypothetical protein
MRDVWLKVVDHSRNAFSRFNRIDCLECQAGFSGETSHLFEISEWHKVPIIRCCGSAIIGHRKQRRFVAPRAH